MFKSDKQEVRVYDLFVAVVAVFAICLVSYRFTLSDHDEVARLVDWFDAANKSVY